MLKLLILLFLFAAATSDLVSLASRFKINLNKPCSGVNTALEKLNTITNNCNVFNVIEVIGCIKESTDYLQENSLKLQKCLDRDSYYELGNLLNSLKENEYCIIFQTANHLNEYLKLNESRQINKELEFNVDIFNLLEESCSIHIYKFSKKIADFIEKSPMLTNFEIIIESWVGFFNKIESNSKGDYESQKLLGELYEREKNYVFISNFALPKDEFWNELYCALKNITSNSDFINYALNISYKEEKVSEIKDIDFYLKKFYKEENKTLIDCSKYTHDTKLISLRIISLVLNDTKESLTEKHLRWALGKSSDKDYENIFERYYRRLKAFFKKAYDDAKYYANKGYDIVSDYLSKFKA